MAFSTYFNFNSHRSVLLNLPRDQFKALKNLSKNQDIIITQPDKGSGIVVINKSDYINKVKNTISDTSKFKLSPQQDIYKVSRTIERKVRNFIRDHLKKPGYISEQQYKRLYPNGSHIGVMYGLPKVHKPGNPVRPICSAVGTASYNLGRFATKIIKPAAKNSLGTDLENTFQFVNQVRHCELNDLYMVSYDVRSLFTNIPLKKIIKICLDRLYRGDPDVRPSIPEKSLKKKIFI